MIFSSTRCRQIATIFFRTRVGKRKSSGADDQEHFLKKTKSNEEEIKSTAGQLISKLTKSGHVRGHRYSSRRLSMSSEPWHPEPLGSELFQRHGLPSRLIME